jgi:type VI secretion system secreted protein VgrG
MSSRFSGATQSTRRVAVKTPLPDNQLLFRQMGVTEELSRLFQMDLSLLSISPDIDLDGLLGKNITVRLQRPDGDMRFFNGFASSAAFGGTEGDFFRYDLVLRPWFWFLTRTSDCRIFQEKTVPQIIEEVFTDQGFSDYENKLSGSYRTWEYCVQYRESDFNFLSRLMEQEGIYYFFRHENGRHVLVLCDGIGSHTTVPGYATIPFYPADGNRRRRDRDHFWHWSANRQLQSGTYALNDFNFKTPFADLQVKSNVNNPHAQADYEVYDYPGEYTERGEGEAYSKARIEETQQPYQLATGQGDAAGTETDMLFTLEGHGRNDQNIEYLVISAQHQLSQGGYQTVSTQLTPSKS